MISTRSKVSATRFLSSGAGLIALAYTPWFSVDAFTPIKYTLSFLCIFYLVVFFRTEFLNILLSSKNQRFLFSAFIVSIAITLLSNPEKFSQRFYGSTERLMGVSSVLLLATLLLIVVNLMSGDKRNTKVKSVLLSAQVSNLIIGCIFTLQLSGFGIGNLEDSYLAPVSTLGNPNFFAAFMSMSAMSWIPKFFSKDEKLSIRLGAFLAFILSIYSTLQSTSFQGILLLAVGAVSATWLILIRCTKLSLTWSASIILSFFTIVMIGISTNFLDIQSRLSSQTFQIRLYYWKVATRMAIDRPFFGWGFDSVGDNFRRFQSLEEYQTRGAGVISDSAHNYFLDFLVAGGLPLAFILVWVWGLTILAAFNYWNTKEALQLSTEILNEVALTAMCIIFFVQCFINPFNIAIAFWGIFIIGSVLSLSYLPKHDSKELNFSYSKRRRIEAPTKRSFLVYLIALIILNPISASTPLWTDHKFRLAAESGNLNDLATISLESPLSNFRFNAVTGALLSEAFIPDYLRTSANIVPPEQLKKIVLDLSYKMVEKNKDSLVAWINIEKIETVKEKREIALEKIQRLDPNNPLWRVESKVKS